MKKILVASAGVCAVALAFAAKDPVIMTVNGVDVPKSEFEYLYNKNSQQQINPQNLEEYVEMFKLYKLKVADARAEVAADFFNSDYYVSLRQRIQDAGWLSTDEWQKMEEALRPVYPDFATTLRSFRLSDVEYQVSLLLKLRIPLKDISTVMYKDATTISSIRSRLYKKVFQKKGGSRDWDDFIATL